MSNQLFLNNIGIRKFTTLNQHLNLIIKRILFISKSNKVILTKLNNKLIFRMKIIKFKRFMINLKRNLWIINIKN